MTDLTPDEIIARIRALNEELGPLPDASDPEARQRERLRRFDLAHGITPRDVAMAKFEAEAVQACYNERRYLEYQEGKSSEVH